MYAESEKFLLPLFPNSASGTGIVKFISGSIAGTSAGLFTYPFDVVRTRLAYQTTGKLYNGIIHAFYIIAFKEGIRSMFKGITPSLCGVGIYGGTTFSIFFSLKNYFENPGNVQVFIFGSFAGLIGQVASYPFDVVRKRMLAHGFIERVSNFKSSFAGEKVSGMGSFFKLIWKYEGYRGLLKGISLNFIKAPIMLGTVHLSNHLINKQFSHG